MSLVRVGVCLLIVMASWTASLARADDPQPPKPLPKEIADAWKKAGAQVGWMGPGRNPIHSFPILTKFTKSDAGKAGELPAFGFPPEPAARVVAALRRRSYSVRVWAISTA
jgi:hypothetical protein